jgi:ZIP family zinc transporter
LINYIQLLILGAFAGLTIFLGLTIALLQRVSSKAKGFLNAVAIGILIFLTVDVFSHAWNAAEGATVSAFAGTSTMGDAGLDLLAMFGGIALGLLGLTWYGSRHMKQSFVQLPISGTSATGGNGNVASGKQQLQLLHQVDAYRLSMMIAVGIGAHNFSEGLAIGQSYAAGAMGLAVVLVIGFATHNATEGFGIAAPLTALSKRPNYRYLLLVGLIGGGPTFIGTALGSLWSSTIAYIFFLSFAGGALVYVTMLMYNSGRRQVTNDILMVGFFVGLLAGFITDLIVTLGGA